MIYCTKKPVSRHWISIHVTPEPVFYSHYFIFINLYHNFNSIKKPSIIFIQKIMGLSLLVFILDYSAQVYVCDALKYIALNKRIELLHPGDDLLGLHSFGS